MRSPYGSPVRWTGWVCSLALFCAAFPITAAARPATPGYEYLSPLPGSRFVSPHNNIILRSGRTLSRGLLNQVSIDVVGSVSGAHPGTLDVSDDRETVLFQPHQAFAPGESVTVTVNPRGRGNAPNILEPIAFGFRVSATPPAALNAAALRASARDVVDDAEPEARKVTRGPSVSVLGGDLLGDIPEGPSPMVTTNVNGPRTSGHTYVAAFRGLEVEPGFLVILDDYRNPVFYRALPTGPTDFKPQPNGWITYWTATNESAEIPRYWVMDSNGTVVDSIVTGNGYETDLHELEVLPNGHLLLMSYDPQKVRMDLEVPGGRADATVLGLIVQELDLQRRVVFQWRSWDAYAFTDLRDDVVSLTSATVDWVHGNSIDADAEGNLVISARHLNEVTKVSRRTGETIWRFGERAANNDFTVSDDPRHGFSHQHHVRLHPGGRVTLFDNGNYIAPAMSRAVEFEMDEVNRTAKLVWDYRHQPSIYGGFLGSVQKLDDGGTLICWGGTFGVTKFTELLADGTVAYDAGFTPIAYNTYRAFRGPWRTTRIATDVTELAFGAVLPGQIVTKPVTVSNPGPGPLEINSVSTFGDEAFSVGEFEPVTLAVGETVAIPVTFAAGAGASSGRLYVGNSSSSEMMLQEVDLHGEGAGGTALRRTASLDAVTAEIAESGPRGASIRYALARPSRVEVAVFGLRGNRVATIETGFRGAGEHQATWSSDGVPSGVYFLRVQTEEGSVTRKLAVLH